MGAHSIQGVRDERDAKAIEVTEGSETLDIDIKLSEPETLYEARGRVLDASTGTPLANVRLAYNASRSRQEIGELTDAQGEFILQGLLAGKYTTLLRTDSESEYYSDPITFEIQDHDVGGLEVKAYRSASISGIIVFEGTTDPAVLKRMPMVRLDVSPSPQQRRPVSFSFSSQMAKPDGTFRLAGLRPGTHRINANDTGGNSPFRFVRIERDGVNIGTDIDLAAGEQVAGIKIVLAYGAGTIRGQIKVVNGSLRPDLQITVFATPLQGTSRGNTRPAQVDAQGKFVMEGLVPGEYELRPFVVVTAGMPQPPNFVPVQQKVTVGTGEISVTLTLDFGER